MRPRPTSLGFGPAEARLLEAEEVPPRRERHGVGEEKNDVRTENVSSQGPYLALTGLFFLPTLEATQGQLLCQSPTDATSGR